MRPLDDRAFNQRLMDLLTRLDRLGRVTASDRGGRRALRALVIEVRIPGED